MSKIGKAYKILQLLLKNGKMSCKELADEIEASERMVRRYIDSLSEADIYIDSVRGRYGGYVLCENNCKLIKYFTENNKE